MNHSNLLSDIWNKFNIIIIVYIIIITLTALFSIFMAWTMWSENVVLYSQHKLLAQELDIYKSNALQKSIHNKQPILPNKIVVNDTLAVSNNIKKQQEPIEVKPQIQKQEQNQGTQTQPQKQEKIIETKQPQIQKQEKAIETKPQIQKKEQKQDVQPKQNKIVQNEQNQKQKVQSVLPKVRLYVAQYQGNIEMLLYGSHILSGEGTLNQKDSSYIITLQGDFNVELPKIDLSKLQIKSFLTGKDADNNTTITVNFYKVPQQHKIRHITPHTMAIILK